MSSMLVENVESPAEPATCVVCSEPRLTQRIVAALGPQIVQVANDPSELDLPSGRAVVVLASDASPTGRVAAIRALVAAGDDIRVVLCHATGGAEVRRALHAGAHGYVLEHELEDTLGPTIDVVLAGQIAVPREERLRVGPPRLSIRERQILGLVVKGHTNYEIASALFLAESTVKSHLSSAFLKLGVRSRSEALDVILDAEQGLGGQILPVGAPPYTNGA
jgi:DNA-binding NarL/FixJ family response regulator